LPPHAKIAQEAPVATVEYHNFPAGPIKDNFGRFR
jgi:hypothetical protein